MKVTIKPPSITQYYFQFEPGDDIYTSCMWAEINLDNESYIMTATSDCGDYSYRWHATPEIESFKKLMSRLDRDYLLKKIADRHFDFDKSKQAMLEYATEWADVEGYTEETLQEIRDLDKCGEELYCMRADDILGCEWESIPVEREYSARAKTFATIFIDYLQPILKEELAKGQSQ